jgi:hypothetical protein
MSANDRWYDRASCQGLEELFFPTARRKGAEAAAQRVCVECPVRGDCLDDAMQVEGTAESRYAVRGGLTSTERTDLQKARDEGRRAATRSNASEGQRTTALSTRRQPVEHGTRRGYQRHRRLGETACEPCRIANAAADRRLRNTGSTVAPDSARPNKEPV